MQESYAKRQVELAKESIAKGKENARRIEQRLREISDYLDEFFGPVSEESIREFEQGFGNAQQKKINDK